VLAICAQCDTMAPTPWFFDGDGQFRGDSLVVDSPRQTAGNPQDFAGNAAEDGRPCGRCGGLPTVMAIVAVDWHGDVHPDQFTRDITFGNVRERDFGEIWTDLSHPLLAGLKNRRSLLHGRCAPCRWLDLCNGNFRARATAVSGDFWGADPACYLGDEEI